MVTVRAYRYNGRMISVLWCSRQAVLTRRVMRTG
nr:MAG TPA: hypothetical protein [Caudoviricetes sp.]